MSRAIIVVAGLLAASLPCVSSAEEALTQASQLNQVVTQALQEFDVPGATVGLWTPNGKWIKAFGLANVAQDRRVERRDHFAIRSITKSFVVTIVLQLIQQSNGSIGLDDPIGNYLPGTPNGDRITLRELANMTSGLFDYIADPGFRSLFSSDPTRSWTTDELLAFAFQGPSHPPVNFEPGARYQYCNTNTLVLGKLIEALTGESFDDVLQDDVLRPLDLANTRYLHGVRLPRPFASGYMGETETGAPNQIVVGFSGLGFAGAMASTVYDLGTWGKALAEGTLLPSDLQAQRFKTNATNVDPKSPLYDAYGLGMGQVAGWWGHTGEGAGYEAAVFHQIENNETFAILLNASNASDVPVQIFCRVLAVLNEAPAEGSDSLCAPGQERGRPR